MNNNINIAYSLLFLLIVSCIKDQSIKSSGEIIVPENWHRISLIDANTHIIEEPQSSQQNVSYLIVGDTKAIMFDTGSGENKGEGGSKMKYQIDKIIDLPTTLVLSHFHFDHNQNIAEFTRVGFPDLPFLREKVKNKTYTFSAEELFSGTTPNNVVVNEWLPVNTDIDLGNRIIQLINIPGHTTESIAIIDKTNKIAFLGDYLYNGVLYVFEKDGINKYKQSIDYLISILDSNYKLYGAHGSPKVPYSNLKKLQDFLICIQNNVCTSKSQVLWGRNTLFYSDNGISIRVFL